MATVSAPKSADYDVRTTRQKQLAALKILRAKATWTAADRDKIITLLMDHILSTS
jgi:hypothetical protein